jgi:hypothetical protein
MAALSWVEDMKVVVRLAPFHRTAELETNPVPFTVRVNAGPPAVAEAGEIPVTVGTGRLAEVMLNACGLDVPPPGAGLNTATCAVPDVAMSVVGIEARNCVADSTVVVRFAPFQRATDPATKFVPLTVSVKAELPATVEAGASPVVVGTGKLPEAMVNVRGLDVPPPGAGLNTVTCAVPDVATSVAGIAAWSCVEET